MNTKKLVDKAKDLFYYQKVSVEGFGKEVLISGYCKTTGRLFAAKFDESLHFPWRTSIEKLQRYSERIIDLTKDSDSIAVFMNQLSVNKKEIAEEYSKLLRQPGTHALPLFTEHFLRDAEEKSFLHLTSNGFGKSEAEGVLKSVKTYHFDIFLFQTTEAPVYYLEVIPVFEDTDIDDVFGSRVIVMVPVTRYIPGIENFSKSIQNFIRMKGIGFAERFSELPLVTENNPGQAFVNDKHIIAEWSSSKELWYIKSEQWILNFLSQLAVAYIDYSRIKNKESLVGIGDHSFDRVGASVVIMNN